MTLMTPQEIVHELDQHIVGQADAKKAVAIALRNRWRRMQLPEALRSEVTPKNILMIGPTGVGKTEIARRLARLANAPFIKVEATKFTEVGYVGRDVESIIRDLADIALKMTREIALEKVAQRARDAAEERILDILIPPVRANTDPQDPASEKSTKQGSHAREVFRKKLRDGELDDKEIELEVASGFIGVEIMAPPGMEEMTSQLQSMMQGLSADRKRLRQLKIRDALRILQEEESNKLLDEDELKMQAIQNLEQNGIVFLDELDKVTRRSENMTGGDVSREGVQRDLLPLVEGSTVSTRYGMVKTDHILFIASGAFHFSKPSDLIPELQGRLPIRVELQALSVDDFMQILTEPTAALTTQYMALLQTESVKIEFSKDGIKRIAEIAWHINEKTENIGARRLHTVLEKLLEDVSFHACSGIHKKVKINAAYVNKQLGALAADDDLSRYIL